MTHGIVIWHFLWCSWSIRCVTISLL